jgi:organic radical activating enzyme
MWEKELGIIHQGSKDVTPILDILKKMVLSDIVITGGEPMLDDDCINFLLDLDFNPARKINLVTNLSYGKHTFNKLLNIISKHPYIRITCSIDDIGDNISRKYLNWDLWDRNFKELVNNLQSRKQYLDAFVNAKITLNVFNYKKIGDIFRYVLSYRKQKLQRVTVAMGSVGSHELSSLNSIQIDKNYKVDISASDFNLLNRYEKSLIDSVNNMIQNSQFNKEQANKAVIFFTKHI